MTYLVSPVVSKEDTIYMKKIFILLILLIPVIALLYFSLTRDPRLLPSALINKPAPNFDLETLEGGRIALSGAPGNPVVLNFWSTWCGPCLAEHRLIKRMQEIYGPKGVHFYAILYEDTPENAKEFIRRFGEGAPILLDPGLKTAIDYGVTGVPETFFIDRTGKVIYKHAGVLTFELVDEQLGPLLIQKAMGDRQ